VTSVNLSGGTLVATGKTGQEPEDLAVGGDALWVANSTGSSVWRLDPASLDRTAEITLRIRPNHIAFGHERVWAASTLDQKLAVIEADDQSLVTTIDLEQRPTAMTVGDDEVFLAGESGGLFRIDARSLKVTSVMNVPGIAYDLASSNTGLWLAVGR
jgi:hypothetical protein